MTEKDVPSARNRLSGASVDALEDSGSSPRDGAERASDEGNAARPNRGRSALRFCRDILVILLTAILISFLVKTFLIRSFYIPSESMENTLIVNDRIIVNELEPSLMPIQHGDVVVFKDPGGWLPPTNPAPSENGVASFFDSAFSIIGLTAPDSNDHLIKRVIGLPGDKVACCNSFGQMTVNGVPLDEPYLLLPAGVTAASKDPFSVTVPKNSLWVMGDNRYNSKDSRYNRDEPGNGFVPFDDVVGRAVLISWPIDRWTTLSNYPLTFSGVESGDGSAKNNANQSDTPTPTTTSGR